jgi:hypothetical protein
MTVTVLVQSSFIALAIVATVPRSDRVAAQDTFPDIRAVVEFQRAADAYAFLHRQAERRLGQEHRKAGRPVDSIESAELATAIINARSIAAPGSLFTPSVAAVFREVAARASRAPGCDPGELRTGVWDLSHEVNSTATGTRPLAACIATALPALPEELEYRSAGTVLAVVDAHANLVVDILPALLAGSDLRQ